MVGIVAIGTTCALGRTTSECAKALFSGELPALSVRICSDGTSVPVFAVDDLPPIPTTAVQYDCRNNRLAYACYQQIESDVTELLQRVAPERVGVVLGSSTSGLDASENAFRNVRNTGHKPASYNFDTQHAMGSLSQFVATASGARGPAYTVSTACSSAAKAMLSAKALIDVGMCDAVITGGIDTLCDLTINGFGALGQLSDVRMNPLSENRSGLNIGEGGALFLLTREPGTVSLLGGGESMDAYHMSAPHPQGEGAALAMTRALADASVAPDEVAYVNLHGTATRANDAMESVAVHSVVPNAQVSSSKPFFGHCLGAAGAVEAAVCCISLMDAAGRLPVHVFDGAYDSALPSMSLADSQSCFAPEGRRRVVLSNSFAFGGNNCSIVLSSDGGGAK